MLLDLIFGTVVGVVSGYIFAEGIFYPYLIAALLFSVAPDVDFLIYHSFNPIDRMSHRHRRILHYPLIYVPVGTVLVTLFSFDYVYGIIFAVTSLIHFIHDSYSIGYGVQWNYPMSKSHFFLGKKTDSAQNICMSLYKDDPALIDSFAQKHGDDVWHTKHAVLK